MAVVDKKQTLPLLTGGMNLNDPSNGNGWIQNLNHYQNAWETRDGFGVMGVFDTQMLIKSMPPSSDTSKGDLNIGFVEVVGVYAFVTDFGHNQQIVILKSKGNNSVVSHFYPEWQVQPEASAGLETTFYTAVIHDITTNEFLEEPLYLKTTERQTVREIQNYPLQPTPKDLIGSSVNVGNQHGAQESSVYPYNSYSVLKETVTTPIQINRDYELSNLTACFFTQYLDKVYFGNAEIGVHYYVPTIFTEERLKRVENYNYKTLLSGYSETSVIKKVVFGDSTDNRTLDEGYTFYRNSEIPVIVDICMWNDRMVYLTKDRRVLYSQIEEPYAIISDNTDLISSEYEPTAIAEVAGRLQISTPSETIILQPIDQNILASGGRQIKVSSTIGCSSCASKIRQEGVLYWADSNAFYVSSGGGDIIKLSEPIMDKFFKEYITNAMTNYYTTNGWTTISNQEQPKLNYAFNSLGLQMIYDDYNKHIVWNFTQLRLAVIFALDTKEFYLWNFQSIVDTQEIEIEGEPTTVPAVGAKNNLGYFWLSSVPQYRPWGVFVEKEQLEDATVTFEDLTTYPNGNPTGGSYVAHHICFTEYGRGGSLDRSQELLEERRKITSGYVKLFEEQEITSTSLGTFYFEKGFWQSPPYTTPNGDDYTTSDPSLSDAIYWLPISIQLEDYGTSGQVEPPNVIYCTFRFDNLHWKPVFNPNVRPNLGNMLDFDLPTERVVLARAFGGTTPSAGVAECSCYDPLTNTYDYNGNEIRIAVDPNASMPINSYSWYPAINMIQYWKNPFVFLPFRKKITGTGNSTINNSFSLGITPAINPDPEYGGATGFQVIRNAGSGRENDYVMSCNALYWMETYTYPILKGGILGSETSGGGGNREASKFGLGRFQPIDWLYKSPEVGDGKVGLKPRGTIAQMSSRGKASAEVPSEWNVGIYNILVSTNYKEYQGQLLDYETTLPTAGVTTKSNTPANNVTLNKDTNITSIYQVSSEDVIPKTFQYRVGGVDANIVLGDPADSTKGNYLIDGRTFINKVTSDGTRGERFTYTFFGHLRNKAEKLYFKSIDAIFRVIGSVRRTGR